MKAGLKPLLVAPSSNMFGIWNIGYPIAFGYLLCIYLVVGVLCNFWSSPLEPSTMEPILAF